MGREGKLPHGGGSGGSLIGPSYNAPIPQVQGRYGDVPTQGRDTLTYVR